MLQKMRTRFVAAAMAAFAIVMLALVVGINIINYIVVAKRQDDTLAGIMEYEELRANNPPEELPMIADMPWADGPEADYTTRFYAACCDVSGNVVSLSKEHITGVDIDEVKTQVAEILGGRRSSGYLENYRYMVSETEDGIIVLFLDVTNEQRFNSSLLWVSVIVALFSLAVVLVLVVLFSGKAILPFKRNMDRQKRFITDAGHELKTPLTSIATSADILAMENEDNEWVQNIQRQSDRMTALVKNLVALARLDEETPFPSMAELSVSDIARQAADGYGDMVQACGKHYTQHIEDGVTMVGDALSIRQLFSILLDNALKYSDEGGEIYFGAYSRHGRVCIEVANTCDLTGMDDLDRLFDRFYRPDESRSSATGGSGIGLSMAKAIVEAHGGKITASTRYGRDLLFKIYM